MMKLFLVFSVTVGVIAIGSGEGKYQIQISYQNISNIPSKIYSFINSNKTVVKHVFRLQGHICLV